MAKKIIGGAKTVLGRKSHVACRRCIIMFNSDTGFVGFYCNRKKRFVYDVESTRCQSLDKRLNIKGEKARGVW